MITINQDNQETLKPEDVIQIEDKKIQVKSGRITKDISIDKFKDLLNEDYNKLDKRLKLILSYFENTVLYI